MTQQHPITPPPELVKQWDCEWREQQNAPVIGWSANLLAYVAARAAQWGADQELEACCEWFQSNGYHEFLPDKLRAARRSKPPSLKEQALEIVRRTPVNSAGLYSYEHIEIIRRALEQKEESSVEPEYHPNLWSAFNGMCKELF